MSVLNPVAAVVSPITDLLKGLGIIKDPALEAQIKEAEAASRAQIEQARDQAWSVYIQSTTPTGKIGDWANTLYTIVRNAGVVAIITSLFVRDMGDSMIRIVTGLYNAGMPGLLILSIPLWEYYGNAALSILTGRGNGNGNGKSAPQPAAPVRPVPIPIRAYDK